MPYHATDVRRAQLHLKKSDPVMREIIRSIGPFTLKPQSDLFRLLVKAIISQQISVAAARAIMGRLEQHVAPRKISAEALVELDPPTLRGLGVSPQKISYLSDLTQRAVNRTLQIERVRRMDDEEAIEHLVQIKGVGRWTAQMALIFGLARLDVLPVADLGIQTAVRNEYGLRNLPKPKKIETLARAWRPYCSIASWYLWQTLGNTPKN